LLCNSGTVLFTFVRQRDFETRTSRGVRRRPTKTTYYRKRSRTGLKLLAFGGIALIMASFALVLMDARILGSITAPPPPKDETLRLTVPKMKRVKSIPVYTSAPDNNRKLDAGAIHIKGTGNPWEREANVYIAGHRLGYPRTGSFLVFYDLNKLRNGDRVVLKDTEGNKYIYKVFNKMVVPPTKISVTNPIAGKNIVSLQACTLPDYSQRLIVQGELVEQRNV